ncbi:MAG TPA: hypothetical protein VL137_03445, partial [Polyangiaceae bacterium]|nr:hypothetical protein [Polyangiaceae bacterium]
RADATHPDQSGCGGMFAWTKLTPPGSGPDASTPDASIPDASTGVPDASVPDASMPDAAVDAGDGG